MVMVVEVVVVDIAVFIHGAGERKREQGGAWDWCFQLLFIRSSKRSEILVFVSDRHRDILPEE